MSCSAFAVPNMQERLAWQVGRYAFVTANFESDDPGWRFWRYFRNWKGRVLDATANCVFDGENDLVVDSSSMYDLAERAKTPTIDYDRQMLDFGTTDRVYHCN